MRTKSQPMMRLPLVLLIVAVRINLVYGGMSAEMKKAFLDKHNELRNKVFSFPDKFGNLPLGKAQNMKKLLWDRDLAVTAQKVADSCTKQHENHDFPEAWRVRLNHQSAFIGENLAGLHPSVDPVETAVEKLWTMNEIALYSWTENTCYADKRLNQMCTHMTQVMWADTEFLGCGYRPDCPSEAGQSGNWASVVCHYMTKGNMGKNPPPFLIAPNWYQKCTLPGGYQRDCEYANLCSSTQCQPRMVDLPCKDQAGHSKCTYLSQEQDICALEHAAYAMPKCARTCKYCRVMDCEEYGLESLAGVEGVCFKFLGEETARFNQGERMCAEIAPTGHMWTPRSKQEFLAVSGVLMGRTNSTSGLWLGYRRVSLMVRDGMTYEDVEDRRHDPTKFRDLTSGGGALTMPLDLWMPGEPDDRGSSTTTEGEACAARNTISLPRDGADDWPCWSSQHVLCEFDLEAVASVSPGPCENVYDDALCAKQNCAEPNIAYMFCPVTCNKCAEIRSDLSKYDHRIEALGVTDLDGVKSVNDGILPGTQDCGCL